MAFQKITEVIEIKVEGAEAGDRLLKRLDAALDGVELSSDSVKRGYDRLDAAAEKLSAGQGKLARAMDKVKRGQREQVDSTRKSEQGFTRLQKQIITTSNLMQGMAVAMRGVSMAQRMATKPISLAVSFERQFALIKTLTDRAGPELRKGLLDLARQIPFDAGQVAVGAYNAISNGLDPAKVVGFLKAASDSAVGTGGQLTDSVKVLLAATSAYGKQGETAATIADKMQTTIKAAVINGQQLSDIMGEMTSAAAYNVKFEEMASAVGAMTLIGVKPQLAIIRANQMLKAITATTGHSVKAFKELGVEAGVLRLKKVGLTGILRDLQKATGGQIDKITKLTNNKRALDGFIGVLGDNYKNYNKVLDANSKSMGAASKASAIMAKTSQGQISRFKSAMEGVLRKMGDKVLPTLNQALARLERFLSENHERLSQKFKTAINSIMGFGQWLIANGKTIMYTMLGIFSGQMLANFSAGLVKVQAQIAAMGTASFGQKFLMHLRSPGFLGLLLGAAVPVGQALGSWIGSKMAAGITASGVAAMQEMKRRADVLDAWLRKRGMNRTTQAQAQADIAAGRGLLASPTVSEDGAVKTNVARMGKKGYVSPEAIQGMPIEKVRKLAATNKKAHEAVLVAAKARLSASKAAAINARKDAILIKKRTDTGPSPAALAIGGAGASVAEQVARQKVIEAAEAKAQALENRAAKLELRIKSSAATLKGIDATVAGEEARRKKAAAEEAKIKKILTAGGKGIRGGGGGGGARRSAEEARRRAREAADLRNQRRLTMAYAQNTKDRDQAELAAMYLRHNFELEDAEKRGQNLLLIKQRHLVKEGQLIDKIRERHAKKEEADEKKKLSTGFSARDRDIRLAELRGDKGAAAELKLGAQLDEDLARFKAAGFATVELERHYAKERIRIRQRMAAQQTAIEMQLGANISQSIETTIGAAKQVAEAFGASDEVISGINAAMILSRSAFHTFMGFSELANAASAMAGAGPFGVPNPMKATAHKFAAASHFASAAVGAVQAGASMVGAGGGSGSSSYSAAQTPTNASVGQSRSQLAAERDRPAVVFGDIVLADVPALLSRAGAKALGAQIAGEVAQELGRRSNIQGTARISGRAMRNS